MSLSLLLQTALGFVPSSPASQNVLYAAPTRLEENAEGVVFVNDKVRPSL